MSRQAVTAGVRRPTNREAARAALAGLLRAARQLADVVLDPAERQAMDDGRGLLLVDDTKLEVVLAANKPEGGFAVLARLGSNPQHAPTYAVRSDEWPAPTLH